MPALARVGDQVTHNHVQFGSILTGAARTLVEGVPAARVGDLASCPTHGPQSIASGSANIIVPAGTICRAPGDADPIPFETVQDLHIGIGQSMGEVAARQGARRTETFTGTGLPGQRLVLASDSVAHGTVQVLVDDSLWDAVEHFADSVAADQHYRIDTDGLSRTLLTFGDGRSGAMPASGAAITISYLVTLGPGGNLAPDLITELVSPIIVSGPPPTISVTNPVPATGGAEAESHDHARMTAPAVLRSTWKAVTKADYQALCEAFPGVAKAQVLDLNDDTTLRIYTVRVVIAPEGGGLPSPQLKADLLAMLDARRMVTIAVGVDDPIYRAVPIAATLYLYADQSADTVQQRALAALDNHFAFDAQTFGRSVYTSDLIALLDGVPGVSHVALQTPASDVILAPRELATLGTVTLTLEVVH